MKQMGKLKGWIIVGLIVSGLGLPTVSMAENIKPGTVTVRALQGSASYKRQDGSWALLKVGMNLTEHDAISTGASTTLDLFLRQNGPVLRVMSSTSLAFDQLNSTETDEGVVVNTQLNLSEGRILGNVKKLTAASKYEIKTPNGVAGIRGTDFDVTVEKRSGQYVVHFTCIKGTLIASALANSISSPMIINSGETWTPGDTDKKTVTPETLEELTKLLTYWDGKEGERFSPNVTVPTVNIITRIDPLTGSPTE